MPITNAATDPTNPSGAQMPPPAGMGRSPDPLAAFEPLPVTFFKTASRLGKRSAYWVRGEHEWEATTWQDYAEQVSAAARSLLSRGVMRGDAVAILSFNRPEWTTLAVAAMSIGAVPVGIYWTSPEQDIRYILNHCKAPVLLVENEGLLAKVPMGLEDAPHLRHIITLFAPNPQAASLHRNLSAWTDFLGQGRAAKHDGVQSRLNSIEPEDIGSLIYTSGTTGPAKAVMLSHGNLWWTSNAMSKVFEANEHDRVISYLPLAHIAEQMGSLHNQSVIGFSVYFASSMEALGEHLKEVKPTIFFGVPRVWEKMQAAIVTKLQQATGTKAKLARWAMRVGQQWHEAQLSGRGRGPWLNLQMSVAGKLVHHKVKEALGFSQARLLSSGAAPIAPETLRFFAGMDVLVRELYGQSEACGPSTLSLPGSTRVGSVGKPLAGTEMAVANDGELLVRGPHIFQRYMGQPAATAEAVVGGWLLTGDLGRIDEDGYVYITGRKKDLIITSGGKNISPGNIEAALMDTRLIEYAVVCGDGRNYLVALLTLDQQALLAFAGTHGLAINADLSAHPAVLVAIQEAIEHVNANQPRVAHIRKFKVLNEPLTVDSGELTPTLKIKRKVVLERHLADVNALYDAS